MNNFETAEKCMAFCRGGESGDQDGKIELRVKERRREMKRKREIEMKEMKGSKRESERD